MSRPDSRSSAYRLAWDGRIAEIRLACGKGNALNARSLAAIADAFDEAEQGEARGVVLAGYDRFFSTGLDLVTLYELDRLELDAVLREFDRVMLRVFAFPRPVVAAVSGHAVAGGLILALACDARIGAADGIRVGLNEIRLGVPFPASALEIVRHGVPPAWVGEVLYGGELYAPAEALARGLLTRLAPADVLGEARALCARWAEEPPAVFEAIKASVKRPAIRAMEERFDYLRRQFVEAWLAPEARRRIGEARARLGA